jgi:uncharacterized membrane protein
MKKNSRAFIHISLSVLILLSLFPVLANAQPGVPCDPLDPACPIDGGLLVLISAGIGLGAKRFKKK